jgi:hypothetical protein
MNARILPANVLAVNMLMEGNSMLAPSLLVPVQELYKDSVFHVPDYQRGYAWGESQVRDLLEDLENIEDARSHYTGTIVLVKKSSTDLAGESFNIFDVIDGQQRLATITILIQCICEEYKKYFGVDTDGEDPSEIVETLRERYLIKKDLRKIVLNNDCDDFFWSHLVKSVDEPGDDGAPVNSSEENLRNARRYISKYLLERQGKLKGDKARVEYLHDLRRKITNSLLINRYVVESDAEAGVIFEVMNDRGKPLSQADKIKNYLIFLSYKCENEDLARRVNDYWGEIFRNLMASKRSSDDDFLRYHWIVYKGEPKEHDIHRRIKTCIALKDEDGNRIDHEILREQIDDYISDLRDASKIFFELNQPYSEQSFTEDAFAVSPLKGSVRDAVDRFHRLRTTATFLDMLRLCESFAFRVYVVGNRRSNTKQSMFYWHAHNLQRTRHASLVEKWANYSYARRDIIEAIRYHSPDSSFTQHLESQYVYGELQSNEIKYFFYELEKEIHKDPFEYSWRDIDENSQVEHIWPQHPRNWDQFTEEQRVVHEENVHRLGNLTITGWNQELSNKDFWDEESFAGKRVKYEESNLLVQRELSRFEKWGVDEIQQRQPTLVEFALQHWPRPNKEPEDGRDCIKPSGKRHAEGLEIATESADRLNESLCEALAGSHMRFDTWTEESLEGAYLYFDFTFSEAKCAIDVYINPDLLEITVFPRNPKYKQAVLDLRDACSPKALAKYTIDESLDRPVFYKRTFDGVKGKEAKTDIVVDETGNIVRSILEALERM